MGNVLMAINHALFIYFVNNVNKTSNYLLDTRPPRNPWGANCSIVPPFQKNLLLNVRKAFRLNTGPFPAANSVSIHDLCE